MNGRGLLSILMCLSLAVHAGEAKTKKVKGKGATLNDLKLVEGDERGNEIKSLKAELLVSSSETRAIGQATRLLRKYKGTPTEPGIRFRLAELYMRKAKTDRFFEVHRDSETVVRFTPRVSKLSSSRATIQRAINEYGLIQKHFTTFPQMDLVVFNQAFAHQTLGNDAKADDLYRYLIAKFPRSMLVADAYLAVGEIEFSQNKFSQALQSFNAIRKYPNSRVYPYGLYKAAWTHYNLRDAAKGLKTLEEVVAFGRMVAEKKIDARLDLRKEALFDMTIFYEDVYPSKSANQYFTEQAGASEVGPILLRLGDLYERHSRFNDQRIVLEQFIEDLPTSSLLPQVHTDLVYAHDHMREKPKAVVRLENFASLCEPSSRWSKANKGVDCVSALNEASLKMAKKWLGAWKKIPKDLSYAEASEKAFEIYLKTAPAGEEQAKSRFAYAELLFDRKKFREASAQYALVSQDKTAGKVSADASYSAVLSLEKAVGDKWSAEDEKSFHELAAAYVALNPKGQYRLDVEYKMALLAYDKERYDEAAPIFLRLGKQFAGQDKGNKAQDLYLDILNIKKDYRGIRNYAQDLMRGKPSLEREARLRKLYEQAYFLEIQGLEEKNQLQAALTEYQKFAKQNPKSDLTEKAVWNSMQLQFKLGDIFNGSKTAVDFATRYPNSPQAINALLKAAQSFESMAQLTEAARVLEVLSVKDQKSAKRWRELAADFYAMDGHGPEAKKIYNDLRVAGDYATKARIVNKLEAFEKAYGTANSQADILRMMIDMNVQPQANLAKVKVIEDKLERGKATDAFNEARHALGSSGLNANQKARLRMVQAKVLEQEFLKQSVKSRAERVATVIALKTEKLQKVQEALQGTIKYGDPQVSLEAFERLYNCYSHFVTALKEMPTPTGLNAEDAKAFRNEISNMVIPLEEKSVDTLAQAVQFARKQPTIDGTAARLEAELDRVNQKAPSSYQAALSEPEVMVPSFGGLGL